MKPIVPLLATRGKPQLRSPLPHPIQAFIVATAFYDWSANPWLVPINAEIAQMIEVGSLPVQLQAGFRYYADGPSGAPEWGLRFTITPIFREWIKSARNANTGSGALQTR